MIRLSCYTELPAQGQSLNDIPLNREVIGQFLVTILIHRIQHRVIKRVGLPVTPAWTIEIFQRRQQITMFIVR